ncbi:hypothetical protein [Actinoplanes sp. NPDC051494]|uniref:hypothetical protein n=1 Tax=Actinoplanes sp. NPDC051494 TaxID=3363907 RepID=UPI00378FEB7F
MLGEMVGHRAGGEDRVGEGQAQRGRHRPGSGSSPARTRPRRQPRIQETIACKSFVTSHHAVRARRPPVTIISSGDGALAAAHAASAAALPGGRLVVATGAGHNVMLTRPGLVVEEIRRVLPRTG